MALSLNTRPNQKTLAERLKKRRARKEATSKGWGKYVKKNYNKANKRLKKGHSKVCSTEVMQFLGRKYKGGKNPKSIKVKK